MSIRQLSPAVITTASLILAACGPAIRTARDEAIPIPQGATWAWGPRDVGLREGMPRAGGPRANVPPADGTRDPQGVAVPGDEIVLQRFQRAVAAAMEAKAFRQVEAPADADFLLTVGYRTVGTQGSRGSPTIGIGIGIGGRWGGRGRRGWYAPMGWDQVPMGGMARPMAYRESALVAMLRQRSTGYLAWRGQVATDGIAAGHLTQERMNELVAKLFRNLP